MVNKRQFPPMPLQVSRALKQLGCDLALARRRRRISQASMAERIGIGVSTLRRLEKGDRTISVGSIARALHVLGEIKNLAGLLDSAKDEIGISLMNESLAKRIH